MGDALAILNIEAAVYSHRQSRFVLGQQLFLGHMQSNKWRRKPESMTSYITFISVIYPQISKRSYLRLYRVYEKLIVEAKLSEFKLMDFAFSILVTAAECQYLSTWQRSHIITRLHTYLSNGASQQYVRKLLKEYCDMKRFPNPRFRDINHDSDGEVVSRIFTNKEEST